jgi:hypothetical protein
MNWTKLTLLTGVAAAVVAVPCASAQDQAVAPAASAPTQMTAPSSASVSGGRPSGHWRGGSGEWRNRGGSGNFTNRSGNWNRGDQRHWGSGNHHRWHRRPYHRSRFYYSSYPFGYPYGYGYGFDIGRPFYGTAADYYFNGYYYPRGVYYDSGYSSQRSSGGSIAQQVQQELAAGGFYRGAIDGVIGNGTRQAIRAYERANGLRVDGRIDNELLRSMGLS